MKKITNLSFLTLVAMSFLADSNARAGDAADLAAGASCVGAAMGTMAVGVNYADKLQIKPRLLETVVIASAGLATCAGAVAVTHPLAEKIESALSQEEVSASDNE